MKFPIFTIVLTSYALQVFGETYTDLAMNLSMKIQDIEKSMSLIQAVVNTNLKNVNSSDLNIRKERRVAAVQNALNQKGTADCKKHFEDALQSVLVEARKPVVARLKNVLTSLVNFQSVLESIKPKLNGKDLDREIGACYKSAKQCNLTEQYPAAVDSAFNAVTSISKDMSSPLTLIVDTTVSNKINTDIVQPINTCLTPH